MKTKIFTLIRIIFITVIIAGMGMLNAVAEHNTVPSVVSAPSPYAPDDAKNVELVGQIGGTTHAVAIQGNYAYIGEGGRLTILNITDPQNPSVVGKTSLLQGVVEGVTVSGDYAYVADYKEGLRVIDVSDPTSPTEVGYYNTPGYAEDVAVSGDYAYVADGGGGIFILRFVSRWSICLPLILR